MDESYFSFLLCFHKDVINIYYSGIPIGEIRDNKFELHQFLMADGGKRMLTIHDLPYPRPFKSVAEIKRKVIESVRKIKLK